MKDNISIKEIFDILKKRLLMISSITVIAVTAGVVLTFFVLTPTYQTSTLLLINQSSEDNQESLSGDINTQLDLINTYNVIISSPRILNPVIEELSLELNHEELKDKIRVGSEEESQVVSISVNEKDPVLAMDIANKIAEIFTRDVVDIMSINNVSILSEASLEETPIRPIPPLNIVISLLGGLMFSTVLSFFLESLDHSVRTEGDVEEYMELPVLGTVAQANKKNIKSRNPAFDENSSLTSDKKRSEKVGV
ncbi:capsule biosynthesis protein [Salibacterium salarium]|uniref:Capsule biosynthesis protein n=1 Tax=Salibacterium salarium TaxID=284579 RepID=A0A3R9RBX0_9BACI|nr:Wzz/FepE/Etk N-terminal domain-containing protein [Salibacterium salarium]RSL31919.1 capsule biosynthesis protein [Salibacterium salarium]